MAGRSGTLEAPSGSRSPEEARLASFLRVSFITSVVFAVLVGTLCLVLRRWWLVPIEVLVVLNIGACLLELRLLSMGRVSAAIYLYAAADWVIALTVVALVPAMLPVGASVVALPIITAMPFLRRRGVELLAAAGAVVMLAAALLGTLQDFSGLSADLPGWLKDGLLIVLLPFIWTYTALNASYASARMVDSLSEAETANVELRRSRTRLVAAGDRERRRIERNLHDGAQQRLLAMRMRMSAARAEAASREVEDLVTGLDHDLVGAMDELRALARGLYPPLLVESGLESAVRALAAGSPIAVEVTAREPLTRQLPEVEAALYFCCAEVIQNTVRHAGPDARVRIEIAQDDEEVRVVARDDGPGFDPAGGSEGSGLENIRDRMGAVGGSMTLCTASGEGVEITLSVPAPRSPAGRPALLRVEVEEHRRHPAV